MYLMEFVNSHFEVAYVYKAFVYSLSFNQLVNELKIKNCISQESYLICI